jgi:cytochrome c biogenesis protein CcdA/thiol-disulfide isomerase/thioredoxin
VIVLIGIAFVAGVITAISPCVVPVLPILLAGGATGGRGRPYAILGGLVASFTAFTLAGAALLDALGLPDDTLRNVALALLFLLAATLLFPPLALLLERPFYALTRRRAGVQANGFVLGASLGLVFVPCAGPVLAAVTALSATGELGARTVAVTIAYALGAAGPMLAIALTGRRLPHVPAIRTAAGAAIAVTALAIALGFDQRFTTALPGYTNALQTRVERNDVAKRELRKLNGVSATSAVRAPEFQKITRWLNGPPLTLRRLRGKVVLIDFWTYSCVNCIRTFPHLKAWDAAYRSKGLVIVGVHSPEFAFERVPENVERAVAKFGLRYPVALDNDFATWRAYHNQYWPAEYLIDRTGRIRRMHFGEGRYDETEAAIRRLLGEPGQKTAEVADQTPRELTTPETYLGYVRLDRFVGSPVQADREGTYAFPPVLLPHQVAYAGRWRVESQRIVAGDQARLRLDFIARHVYLVLGGQGAVEVWLNGRFMRTVTVEGPQLYRLLDFPRAREGVLELRFARGLEAYAFTFG